MEISLSSPARRWALPLIAPAIAGILIVEASVLWRERHLLDSQKIELVERAAALVPDDASAWDRAGRMHQWDLAHPDLSAALADYERAVEKDPRSARYWMDLAGADEAAGDTARAQDAFIHAKTAYPASPEVAFQHANFLLRQREDEAAFAELQRAVRIDSTLLPLAISRTWRATGDVNLLVDQVLPANAQAYLQAVYFFAVSSQAEPALAVWRRLIGLRQPFALGGAFALLDTLIYQDRGDDARRVWRDALEAAGLPRYDSADSSVTHSLIWNGDFSTDFANGGLDWRWRDVSGASFSFDSAPAGGGTRSVRLDFSGGNNLELDQPWQYVPVEPGRAYHLHAVMRTEGITTESGVRFAIGDPNHSGGVNIATEDFTGSHPWTPVEVDLTTGPHTHFLLIRLIRNRSRMFDNKLAGTVWIAGVSLVPTATPAKQPSR